ncbi:MAG TPA: peroxiredoxin-like family protein [Sphingobium sp.]
MATVAVDTLKAQYAALQAERERTWSAPQLAANARQRQILTDRFDPSAIVQPGDILPPLHLVDVEGDAIGLDDLTADGPAVLIFFRFAGCPACNIALPHYDHILYPYLRSRTIPLVAVSPQRPDRLRDIKDRHQLALSVASDPGNGLARALGISFVPDDRPEPPPAGWIGDVTGTGTWELPQPAVLLIGPGRVVEWIQVSPDWLDRPESDDILARID